MTVVILGGGAAGFFAALAAKEASPHIQVILMERASTLLGKVRISGGGRCNVTHACFHPKELIRNYPRGSKELLGPFTRFQPQDTIRWFEERGVSLKTEEDGRMFPVTDSSATIIDCLMREAKKLGVQIRTRALIDSIERCGSKFVINISGADNLECEALLMATGSHPSGYKTAQAFGHTIVEPVPSLFTFNIPNFPLKDLSGIAVAQATVTLPEAGLQQTGPLLITHWGFSGPAALKLSAWGARYLHGAGYRAPLTIDWLPQLKADEVSAALKTLRTQTPSHVIMSSNPFKLPKNLWRRFLECCHAEEKRFSDLGNDHLADLVAKLKSDAYRVEGKTTNKEEFVTCGGVTLGEVNFKTMESRRCPGLYFAGEILDIDAVTGGFNFQNAWTTGWIAGHAMVAAL